MSRSLMTLADFDLNLLLVFQALMEEQSVTRAAQKLRKAQSSVSEALARLRESLGDPLFIRSGGVMRPTARARQIAPIAKEIIAQSASLVDASRKFDPASADGEVRICMTEYGASLFLRHVYDAVTAQAPNVTLRCTPSYGQPIEASLRDSSHDLAIGALSLPILDFHIETLIEERLVCLMDAGHPLAKQGGALRVTTKDLARFPHLKVAVYRSRNSIIDDVLQSKGIAVGDSLTVGDFLIAPQLLKGRPLLFLCGERFAERAAAEHGLCIASLPKALPSIPIKMAWHRRTDEDDLLAWLRQLFRNAADINK